MPATLEPTTTAILASQIKGMLAYWREETADLDHETIISLEAERQNLLRAVKVGLLFPQTRSVTAEILNQAFPFTEQRGYWPEWIPLLERCLEHSEGWETASRVLLMNRLGQAYRLENKMEQAISIHLEAEQLAKSTGPDSLVGRVQHDLLEDYLFSRAYEKAKVVGQSAISLLGTAEYNARLVANCYKMLGVVYHESGDMETAESYFRTAVQHWRSLNNPLYLARALSDLARPLIQSNQFEEAEKSLREAADLLAPTIYELDKSTTQINLGTLYAARRDWEAAETAFHQANSSYLRQSVKFISRARVNNNLGYVLYHQGRYEVAEEYLRQSIALWEQVGDDLETANTMSTLADSLRARNQLAAALPLYRGQ